MKLLAPFGTGAAAGHGLDVLGEAGLELDRLTALGVPIVPGFTILASSLESPSLRDEIEEALATLERDARWRSEVDGPSGLLLVQASAAQALPGCPAPIEDVGLSPGRLSRVGAGPTAIAVRLARLVRTLAPVMGVAKHMLEDASLAAGPEADPAVPLLEAVGRETGRPFPADALGQLLLAVELVRSTWGSPRARSARRAAGAPDDLGIAVHVQLLDPRANGRATVASRDHASGERRLSGTLVEGDGRAEPIASLHESNPEAHRALDAVMVELERHLRDAAVAECEIANAHVRVLRAGIAHDRQAAAAVRIAVELAADGVIAPADAIARISASDLERLLHPRLGATGRETVLVRGLGASPGAASGRLCLSSERAEALAASGERVILVKAETVPEDLPAMTVAAGIVTTRGGSASHAAVVARGMGKPAVCGAAVTIDREAGRIEVDGQTIDEGELLSIDGNTGVVMVGAATVVAPESSPELETLLGWCDGVRKLGVRANADNAEDARIARSFGAEGIGLCRTEHQFLGKRLPLVQRYILAADAQEEQDALDALAAVQREDFIHLLEEMDGLPVTVRLLDPPLHEFLPDYHELIVGEALGTLDDRQLRLLEAASAWRETNPMLGVRGVRLAMLKPGLYPAQARALFEAAVERIQAGGNPIVEVMVPLVVARSELAAIAGAIRAEAESVFVATGVELAYTIGSMIETPRAALVAPDLAQEADFFSFGTNDLTQLTFGFSRDDVEHRMLPYYLQRELLRENPFRTVDVEGVGRLVKRAAEDGRATRPDLKLGVCGEHGGDPASIAFFATAGLDYVSCSPYRVPIARLAAAHAALATS